MAKKQKTNLTLDEAMSKRAQRRPALLKAIAEAAAAHAAGKPYDGEAVVLALEELGEARAFFDAEVDIARRRLGFNGVHDRLVWWEMEIRRRGRIWRRTLFRADAMHKLIDLRVQLLRNRNQEALVARNGLLKEIQDLRQNLLTCHEREQVKSAKHRLSEATDQHKRMQQELTDLRSNVDRVRHAARFAETLHRDMPEQLRSLPLPTSIFRSIPSEVQLPMNGNALDRKDAEGYIEKMRSTADRYEAEAAELEPKVAEALNEVERSRRALEDAQASVPRFEVNIPDDTEDRPVKRVFSRRVLDKAAAILASRSEDTDGHENPGVSLVELERVLEEVFAESEADRQSREAVAQEQSDAEVEDAATEPEEGDDEPVVETFHIPVLKP